MKRFLVGVVIALQMRISSTRCSVWKRLRSVRCWGNAMPVFANTPDKLPLNLFAVKRSPVM